MAVYEYESQYQEVPSEISGQWARFTQTDVVATAIYTLFFVLLIKMLGMLGVILGIILYIALSKQLKYSRVYFMLFIAYPLALKHRKAKGFNWKSSSKRPGITDSINDLPGTDIALSCQHDNLNEVSVVIEGSGSDITTLSLEIMRDTHLLLGDDIASFSKRGWSVTTSFLVRARQWDPTEYIEYELQSFQPGVMFPRILVDGRADATQTDLEELEDHEYAQEVIKTFQDYATKSTTMALVLTIRRNSMSPSSHKTALHEDEVAQQPIVLIAERAKTLMEQRNVTDVKILDVGDMQRYFRESWDVTHLDEFRELVRRGATSNVEQWPKESINTSKSTVSFDSNRHALLRVTSTTGAASPTYFLQVYGVPCANKTVSMVSESMSSSIDYILTGLAIDALEGIREIIGQSRVRPAAAAKTEARLARERDAQANKKRQLHDIWVVVSASNDAILEREVQAALDYYEACGIGVDRVVTLEPLLYPMMWSAMTGIK